MTPLAGLRGQQRLDRWLVRGVALLVVVGVTSALARYLLPGRIHLWLAEPLYGSYAPEQLPVLAAHPVWEALHRLGGAVYLVLGVLQFQPGLRARRPALHRTVGRSFIGLSLVAAVSGGYMAVAFPYEPGETLPALLAAGWMAFTAGMAWWLIRRRDVQRHREWMMRSLAVGLGIATIRVLAVIGLNLGPWNTRQLIAPLFWIGWLLTILAAEAWIRFRR